MLFPLEIRKQSASYFERPGIIIRNENSIIKSSSRTKHLDTLYIHEKCVRIGESNQMNYTGEEEKQNLEKTYIE